MSRSIVADGQTPPALRFMGDERIYGKTVCTWTLGQCIRAAGRLGSGADRKRIRLGAKPVTAGESSPKPNARAGSARSTAWRSVLLAPRTSSRKWILRRQRLDKLST
ncbi:hypothetical protein [Kitasatospora sp. NPDC048407]|uniref:hypothetical protein n=1 Tax=Kitasatospora sp. NPDC048407 TaxID=3364051 RepID=UPI0037125DDF